MVIWLVVSAGAEVAGLDSLVHRSQGRVAASFSADLLGRHRQWIEQEELGRRCLRCGMRCVAVGKEKVVAVGKETVLQSSMDRQIGVAGLHG